MWSQRSPFLTLNPFPEVIAVSPDRGEFTQVVVRAPDVDVLILWTTYDEWIIVTKKGGDMIEIVISKYL